MVTPGETREGPQPLQSGDEMAVEGLTDREWEDIEHALVDLDAFGSVTP